MTQDEIIEIARQAGIVFDDRAFPFYESFAKLVAAKKDAEHKEAMRWDIHSCGPTCKRYACVATREAVKAERVACFDAAYDAHATTAVLEAIRARGEA